MIERLRSSGPSRFPDLDDHLRVVDVDITVGRIYFADGNHPVAWDEFRSLAPAALGGGEPGRHPIRNHTAAAGNEFVNLV